jgi:uncharacterized repeat protein (TIGR01451 family)
MNLKRLFLCFCAFSCAAGCALSSFDFAIVGAQTVRFKSTKQSVGGVPLMSAALVDSFTDTDGDGRAMPGQEITYTATITNNGSADATNVSFTNPVDSNTTLVPGSGQIQPDTNQFAVRCNFGTANGGSGGCSLSSLAYGSTGSDNYTIIGGQSTRLEVTASNIGYNSADSIFSFDASVQNLIEQSLGTIDGVTLDTAGVRLFLDKSGITAGAGSVTAANADGIQNFTAPNQPYFQYHEILAPNQTSAAKTLQFNVPNTVDAFHVNFLISAKAAAKLVVNEVLANPGGTISTRTANGSSCTITACFR